MHHVIAVTQEPSAAAITAVVIGAILAYFVPTIVAVARGVQNQGQVFVVNLLTGWTFFGWVVALVMALKPKPLDRHALD